MKPGHGSPGSGIRFTWHGSSEVFHRPGERGQSAPNVVVEVRDANRAGS
jgi:hypothetical protein